MKLKKWLNKHGACKEGRDWALATGCQTIQEVWLRDDLKSEWRIWIATRKGMVSDKLLRKFACACVREVWHLLTDERSRIAVEVAERYVDGLAADDELYAAWEAALEAARDASCEAAREAACEAAWSAARGAAREAACEAARAAAIGAEWGAARQKQNEILKQLVPTLEEAE